MTNLEKIKELRGQTGLGMMDCKEALKESEWNIDEAVKLLRVQGMAKPDKLSNRTASEGLVFSYDHVGKIGVLLELRCETDFCAKSDVFKDLCKEVSMQIVASKPEYINADHIPQRVIINENVIVMKQLEGSNKPPNILTKIADGKMNKFIKEVCLMDQVWVKDKTMTIRDLITQKMVLLNEKIEIKWFIRRQLGE